MKKIAFIVFLLAISAAAGRAQESRQDISVSGTALIEPFIASSTNVEVNSTTGFGALASYRFMLTPDSALEANYGFTYENKIHYYANPNNYNVPLRTQEISGAFVSHSFSRTGIRLWKRDRRPSSICPSAIPACNSRCQAADRGGCPVRGGYCVRGQPQLRYPRRVSGPGDQGAHLRPIPLNTNKWWNIFEPAVGVAYHF